MRQRDHSPSVIRWPGLDIYITINVSNHVCTYLHTHIYVSIYALGAQDEVFLRVCCVVEPQPEYEHGEETGELHRPRVILPWVTLVSNS